MADTYVYGKAMMKAFSKEIDWLNDTVKVALMTNAYTPDQDLHDYFDDVSANEVTGTGYTQGGITLTTKTITYDSATNKTKLGGSDLVWSSSAISARYGVCYVDTGVASTSPLVGYIDFNGEKTSSNGDLSITLNSGVIFTMTTP